jgi:hypothetical protein
MIIVKINGGLGNQLFQYALGRAIAYHKNTSLKLDINSFETYNLHRYALKNLNIEEKIATKEEIRLMVRPNRMGFLRLKLLKILNQYYNQSYVKEVDFNFDQNIFKVSSKVYLDGYWQSEKYFKSVESIIRDEFVVVSPQEGLNRELADLIKSCESVSIHIRRGDYVSNPHTNKMHGTCDMDYYLRSIEKLAETVKNPHFFVFSDDIEWARSNLLLPSPITFVENNGAEKNYEDLRLMAQCKHNIIANSSFSWWGAWLNKNPDKIVFAPKKWFNDPSMIADDLIPDSWIKL